MLDRLKLWYRARRYRSKLDPAEIGTLIAHTPQGGTAIDLGAHKGAYTYWLRRAVGRSGRVIAVEPQPDLAKRLERLFPPGRSTVAVHWCAVCADSGQITLSVPGTGSSPGASIFSKDESCQTFTVPALSLADLVTHHNLARLDIIKCDTEGAELDIFTAGRDVLNRFRPTLLVECENRHRSPGHVDAFLALFADLDYDASFFYNQQLLPASQFVAATHQVPGARPYANNWLLTPKSR